jgi:hypothetical protein
MDANQKVLYEGLMGIAYRVKEGGYGHGFDIDVNAVEHDMDELLDSVEIINEENEDES